MSDLEIINLGPVDGLVMTNVYSAVAASVGKGERPDVLLLCYSERPFANVGFHQDAEEEIDMDYCAAHAIPVVRRMIGGGAIADGPWEADYFLISPLDSPTASGTLQEYYGRMLDPVASALQEFGIDAVRSGLNDLVVHGRKISANGAVDIHGARVLAGDVLLYLDIDTMAGILRVPDAKFRDKIAGSIAEHLTSMRDELGHDVSRDEVEKGIIAGFSEQYADVRASRLSEKENEMLRLLIAEHSSGEWVFSRDESRRKVEGKRIVKIKDRTYLCRTDYKAQKLIRVTALVDRERIAEIAFSGDFFTVPVDWPLSSLERALVGSPLQHSEIEARAESVLENEGVRVFGATASDFASAVMEAVRHPAIAPGGG